MIAFVSRQFHTALSKDPLFFAAIFAVFGICLAHLLPVHSGVWLSIAAGIGAAVFWRRQLMPLLLIGVLLSFGGLHQLQKLDSSHLDALWNGQEPDASIPVWITGTIVEQPMQTKTGNRALLTIRLEQLNRGGTQLTVQDRIRVWTHDAFRQGDVVQAEGMLTQIAMPRNPGEFSRQAYARDTNGVVAELHLSSHHRIEIIGASNWQRVFHYALLARTWVGNAITRGLPDNLPQAGILKAMVLGARNEANPEAEEPFRLSGSLHIFAVSGLHVGIFGMVIWMLLQSAKVPRRIAIAVIIACVLGYAFITGLRPSAVRAALMTTIFLAGFWFRRKPRLLNSLGFAALLIFLFDTRQLFAVGFQLSFSVLVSIALIGPLVRDWLHQKIDPDPFIPSTLIGPWHRLGINSSHRIADIFSISTSAWIGSLPFIIWYFGLITPVALLANCFLVPIAWFVICFATVSMVGSAIHLFFVSTWLNQLNAWLVLLLQNTAIFFAQLPAAHFQVTPLSDLVPQNQTEAGIIVFDLGRSCAPQVIHVKDPSSGNDLTWLIDCGSESGYATVIHPWLRQQGIRRLDGFIASHGDTAHTGAAPALIEEYAPYQLVTSQLPSMSQAYRNLEKVKARQDISSIQIAGGTGIQISDEAKIDVLYPPSQYTDLSVADDECLILMIHWGGFRILSMSDSGFITEKWLLEHVPDLEADIIIKSHHVADFSGLEEFLIAVDPSAVISTNDGFPENQSISPSWRAMLKRRSIALFDQRETGAVLLNQDGDELVLKGYVNNQELRLSPEK